MLRSLSDIRKIIVHCSDSEFGDRALIDAWHRERGWQGCGYHYVILNGMPTFGKPYARAHDGDIEMGRQLKVIGAHCRGHNADSIGICLIGRRMFTARQIAALGSLFATLGDLGLTAADVYGHTDFNPAKTCPNISTAQLRMLFGGCR